MKKIFYVALALVSSLSVSAASLTARCFITLTSNNGGTDVVKIFENPDYDNAYVSGDDALKNMNSGNATNLNIYSVQGTTNVSEVRTNAIVDLPIIVETNEVGTVYTMSFDYVMGTVKLYDLVEDPTGANPIVLASGDTYEFTLASAARQTIADRFVLNYSAAPAVPGICFNYEKLQITGYAGAQLEVLNYADKASVFTETVAGDNVEIDLEAKGLTANTQYFVKLTPAGATAALEYVIKYKPAVTVVP